MGHADERFCRGGPDATGVFAVTYPPLISAVDVTILKSEPGATRAVKAKSFWPTLFAIARMWPVDGWITTIALLFFILTAACAACSAFGSMVVASSPMFCGETTTAWLFGTALPAAFSICTDRPGTPFPAGAVFCSRLEIVFSPGSL